MFNFFLISAMVLAYQCMFIVKYFDIFVISVVSSSVKLPVV